MCTLLDNDRIGHVPCIWWGPQSCEGAPRCARRAECYPTAPTARGAAVIERKGPLEVLFNAPTKRRYSAAECPLTNFEKNKGYPSTLSTLGVNGFIKKAGHCVRPG